MPTPSDTGSVGVYYLVETNWGEVPAGDPKALGIITSEGLQHVKRTITSNVLDPEANVRDIIEVLAGASGTLGFELAYGALDDLIPVFFRSSGWSTAVAATGALVIAGNPTNTITLASAFTNAVVGQWIRVKGATNAANNGFHRISAKGSANVVTVESPMVSETSAGSASVAGSYVRNGNAKRSVTLWVHFADVDHWFRFRGMRGGVLDLNLAVGAILTGNLTFEGAEGAYLDGTTGLEEPTATVAATTNPVLNATANVGSILEGDWVTEFESFVQSMTFSVNLNTAAQNAIRYKFPIGIRQGRTIVGGALNAYFDGPDLAEAYAAHTATKLAIRVSEGDADDLPTAVTKNTYVFSVPRLQWGGEGGGGGTPFPTAPGVDQDVIQQVPWSGSRVTEGGVNYTVQIDRFAGV